MGRGGTVRGRRPSKDKELRQVSVSCDKCCSDIFTPYHLTCMAALPLDSLHCQLSVCYPIPADAC